jgi:hypothetical protein
MLVNTVTASACIRLKPVKASSLLFTVYRDTVFDVAIGQL